MRVYERAQVAIGLGHQRVSVSYLRYSNDAPCHNDATCTTWTWSTVTAIPVTPYSYVNSVNQKHKITINSYTLDVNAQIQRQRGNSMLLSCAYCRKTKMNMYMYMNECDQTAWTLDTDVTSLPPGNLRMSVTNMKMSANFHGPKVEIYFILFLNHKIYFLLFNENAFTLILILFTLILKFLTDVYKEYINKYARACVWREKTSQ